MPAPSPSPKDEGRSAANQSQKAPSPFFVSIIETPEQAIASQSRQGKSDQHEASDLDAQIRAANAAEEQILPAWVAAMLSGIGTLLIVWTLYETRRNNSIAQKEYGKARIEAGKAYTLAQTTATHQLRPYVEIEKIEPQNPTKETPRIEIYFKNFGQTPAYNLLQNIGMAYCPIGMDSWPLPSGKIELGRSIAPGHYQKAIITLEDWAEEWQLMIEGKGAFRLLFQLEYDGIGLSFEPLNALIIYSKDGANSAVRRVTGNIKA